MHLVDAYGVGRLTSFSSGTTVGAFFSHDLSGNLASEIYCMPNDCSYNEVAKATYDYHGNMVSLTYPDGRTLYDNYDALDRLTATGENSFFTQAAVMAAAKVSPTPLFSRPRPYFSSGAYYPAGELNSAVDGTEIQVTAGFNSRQDITSLAYAASQPLWSKSYHWDTNAQNLLSVTDQITGAVRSFTYDNVNRLISATDSSGSLSDTYTPDAWGNRQESGTFSFAQSFSAANQISATGYTYDLSGNLTADGLGNSYSYDADGKMSASNGAVYTRDPFGQRIVKNYAGAATEYYYFGGQLLATRDPSSSQWTDYIYAGGRLIAEAPSGTTDTVFYRIGDHLDSLAQKTDSTGDLLGANDISPYGELISNTAADRLLFTQHERDTENGSDAALYRQYSSAQGRWLSPDPSSGSYDLTDPQSLNRYAYLGNRPNNSTDSLGLDGEGCGLICIGIEIGVGAAADEWLFGGGGGGYHGNPHSTADTGYGNPDNSNGTDVYPPYVSQQSSDPGSFGESLGIPTGIPQGAWGIGPALGLPSSDSCEFGGCGGGIDSFANAVAAPLGWCAEHPTICTAGADAEAFLRAIPAVAASALLLNMEGDNEDPNRCAEIKQNALAECSELLGTSSYPSGVKRPRRIPTYGSDHSGAFYSCIREKMEAAECPNY